MKVYRRCQARLEIFHYCSFETCHDVRLHTLKNIFMGRHFHFKAFLSYRHRRSSIWIFVHLCCLVKVSGGGGVYSFFRNVAVPLWILIPLSGMHILPHTLIQRVLMMMGTQYEKTKQHAWWFYESSTSITTIGLHA